MGKLTMTRKGGRGRLSHKGKWESAGKRGHKEEGVRRPKENKGCVSHYGFAIYIKKKYLKGKRRIMKIQIFHHAKL
jgi:hypothetical protein